MDEKPPMATVTPTAQPDDTKNCTMKWHIDLPLRISDSCYNVDLTLYINNEISITAEETVSKEKYALTLKPADVAQITRRAKMELTPEEFFTLLANSSIKKSHDIQISGSIDDAGNILLKVRIVPIFSNQREFSLCLINEVQDSAERMEKMMYDFNSRTEEYEHAYRRTQEQIASLFTMFEELRKEMAELTARNQKTLEQLPVAIKNETNEALGEHFGEKIHTLEENLGKLCAGVEALNVHCARHLK